MPLAAARMDLKEIIILSELSQKDREPYDITYMWNQHRTQMNLFKKQTHRQTADVKIGGCQGLGAGRIRVRVSGGELTLHI